MTTRSLAVAVLLAGVLAAPAARAAPSPYVPGEVLVKFKSDAAPQLRASALAGRAHAVLSDLDEGWTRVHVRSGETVEAALVTYAADGAVEHAQPNYLYRISAGPTEPGFADQWALRNTGQTVASSPLEPGDAYYSTHNPGTPGNDIDVERAWNVTSGDCSGAVVAVLDTGVNYQHQDLAANMWNGLNHGDDFVDPGHDPMDRHGHGTHVAGIIGADGTNGYGVSGVCWTARIMAVRVMNAMGSGTSASIISGIYYAVNNGADVINMSLGGGGSFDQAYYNAIATARNAGVVVVVAAGNDGVDVDYYAGGPDPYPNRTYPCSFDLDNVICVAALDQSFALASFSNYGADSVDVGAPGTNIVATWPGHHSSLPEDTYVSGWNLGGGWGVHTDPSSGVRYLSDPWNWSQPYAPNADDRAWKAFSTSGAKAVSIDLELKLEIALGDVIRVACRPGTGDPFAAGGTVIEEDTNVTTGGDFFPVGFDLSRCTGSSTLSLGFQLRSNSFPSPYEHGVALSPMTVTRFDLANDAYNTIHGTSMATPVVAGVVALLRSYHPLFTPADVRKALIAGGWGLSSLSGKTSTAMAVQAMPSLTHVATPTGLAYR